jgi:hypothetical protein
MAGYVYRGTEFDAKPKKGPVPPAPEEETHGTPQGIWRHRYKGEPNCEECRTHYNRERSEQRRRKRAQQGLTTRQYNKKEGNDGPRTRPDPDGHMAG